IVERRRLVAFRSHRAAVGGARVAGVGIVLPRRTGRAGHLAYAEEHQLVRPRRKVLLESLVDLLHPVVDRGHDDEPLGLAVLERNLGRPLSGPRRPRARDRYRDYSSRCHFASSPAWSTSMVVPSHRPEIVALPENFWVRTGRCGQRMTAVALPSSRPIPSVSLTVYLMSCVSGGSGARTTSVFPPPVNPLGLSVII